MTDPEDTREETDATDEESGGVSLESTPSSSVRSEEE